MSNQNILIKTCVLLLSSVSVIVVPIRALMFLSISTAIYLLLACRNPKAIIKGMLIVLPFLASYSVLALAFNVDFITMLTFIGKMLYLVIGFSAFVSSTTMPKTISDLQTFTRYGFFHKALFYLVATIKFTRRFRDYYQQEVKVSKAVNLGNVIDYITTAIHQVWKDNDVVLNETESVLSENYGRPSLLTISNTVGITFITVLILILSV